MRVCSETFISLESLGAKLNLFIKFKTRHSNKILTSLPSEGQTFLCSWALCRAYHARLYAGHEPFSLLLELILAVKISMCVFSELKHSKFGVAAVTRIP